MGSRGVCVWGGVGNITFMAQVVAEGWKRGSGTSPFVCCVWGCGGVAVYMGDLGPDLVTLEHT